METFRIDYSAVSIAATMLLGLKMLEGLKVQCGACLAMVFCREKDVNIENFHPYNWQNKAFQAIGLPQEWGGTPLFARLNPAVKPPKNRWNPHRTACERASRWREALGIFGHVACNWDDCPW